jgi:hypothetical protein
LHDVRASAGLWQSFRAEPEAYLKRLEEEEWPPIPLFQFGDAISVGPLGPSWRPAAPADAQWPVSLLQRPSIGKIKRACTGQHNR